MKVFVKYITMVFTIVFITSASAPKPALKEDYVVTITTKFGDMVLLLHEQTPKHKHIFLITVLRRPHRLPSWQ
jgi:hypothetical protein